MTSFDFSKIDTPPYLEAHERARKSWQTVEAGMDLYVANPFPPDPKITRINFAIYKHVASGRRFFDSFISPTRHNVSGADCIEAYMPLLHIYTGGLKQFAEEKGISIDSIIDEEIDVSTTIHPRLLNNLYPRAELIGTFTSYYSQQVSKHVSLVLEQL